MTEKLWTFLAVVGSAVAWLVLLRTIFTPKKREYAYRNQLIMLGGTLIAAIVVLVFLPLPEGKNEQVITLAGVLLSAALALSSTTFLGNALAGMMLRAIRNFGAGDWVRCGDNFGRVTERGLLHTELQTEDRDLVTLPNLMLVSQPVKVVRRSGTILTAEVSLGYDVPHSRVDDALLKAAREAELEDPFVSIIELGDHSVVYRVAGVLHEVERLISRRSGLRRKMLDALHGAGIEIVSPMYVNTFARGEQDRVLPERSQARRESAKAPEELAFDKADAAGKAEAIRIALKQLDERAEALGKGSKPGDEAGDPAQERARLAEERESLAAQLAEIEAELRETHDGDVNA